MSFLMHYWHAATKNCLARQLIGFNFGWVYIIYCSCQSKVVISTISKCLQLPLKWEFCWSIGSFSEKIIWLRFLKENREFNLNYLSFNYRVVTAMEIKNRNANLLISIKVKGGLSLKQFLIISSHLKVIVIK